MSKRKISNCRPENWDDEDSLILDIRNFNSLISALPLSVGGKQVVSRREGIEVQVCGEPGIISLVQYLRVNGLTTPEHLAILALIFRPSEEREEFTKRKPMSPAPQQIEELENRSLPWNDQFAWMALAKLLEKPLYIRHWLGGDPMELGDEIWLSAAGELLAGKQHAADTLVFLSKAELEGMVAVPRRKVGV